MGKFLERFTQGYKHEKYTHSHSYISCLHISCLDTVKVKGAHGVCTDKRVKSQDLVHLHSGQDGGPALSDELGSAFDGLIFVCEWSCDAGIS